MGIHIPSTACDVIIFNGQGQLCVPTELVQSEEIFQTIPEWAQFSQGHQRKPCNIDLKISMKILFHYPLPVLLKSKFTVTWVSILETQDSILETFKDRVLSLDDKFQISSRELVVKEDSLKVYTYLSFQKLPFCALGETRSA